MAPLTQATDRSVTAVSSSSNEIAHQEQLLRTGVTCLMGAAAAHAVYLAAVPEPLRAAVSIRNAAVWKRVSVGALAVVAAYDGVKSWQHSKASAVVIARLAVSSFEQRKAAQRAALEAKAHEKELRAKAAMERKRAEEAAEREAAFQQLYSEVLGSLQQGTGVVNEAQEVLDYCDAAQRARRESLYQQWHSQVFEPMQERLQGALSNMSIAELETSLRAASQAYVTATNSKRLFRDVIIEHDYNPFARLASSIRIHTADLEDPLLHDLRKTQTEQRLLSHSSGRGPSSTSSAGSSSSQDCRSSRNSRGVTGGQGEVLQPGQLSGRQDAPAEGTCHGLAKALTRTVLPVTSWAAGAIHATPYGHCIDDHTAQYIVKPAPIQSLLQKASHIHFDDFTA